MLKRKLFFLIWMMVSICILSSAQEAKDIDYFDGTHPFTGGIVAGLNASQVDGDNYGGYHKAGLNVGGMVYVNFNAGAGASMELLFSQKGSIGVSQSGSSLIGSYFQKYKLKLNYVEVPVSFHFYHIIPIRNVHFDVGASYAALISRKESFEDPNAIYDLTDSFSLKKYDIEGIIGVSYVWHQFILEARFQYSITPIRNWRDAPDFAVRNGVDERMNMFAFRVGYLFGN